MILIIGGAGRIGSALATVLSQEFLVGIYDTNIEYCDMFRKGDCPYYEPDIDLSKVKIFNDLRSAMSEADFIFVTIGTPIDEYQNPEFKPIYKLFQKIKNYHINQPIGLCSTVYPGTTNKLADKYKLPIAFIPERVATGQMIKEMYEFPQIIAAKTFDLCNLFSELFNTCNIKTYEMLNPLNAELAKLFTNSYRYIHFAITNQFQIICQKFDVNYLKIFKAMTHNYPRLNSLPKPGFAGGYCLRKDTLQLAAYDNNFQLGYAASLTNEYLPLMIFRWIQKAYRLTKDLTIGLLGLTFKGNTDDIRDSLAFRLKKILQNEVKEVLTTDPYIKGTLSLNYILENSDLLIICAYHNEYKNIEFNKLKIPTLDLMGQCKGGLTL